MTERQEKMIAAYIPHDADPDLRDGEYYFRQNNRVIRVLALDIFPGRDGTFFGIYQRRGGRLVRVGEAYKSCLYDNKQDCKDMTHDWVEEWEALRELQRKEARV